MKRISWIFALALIVGTAAPVKANFIIMQFASVPGASVSFDTTAGTFTFDNSTTFLPAPPLGSGTVGFQIGLVFGSDSGSAPNAAPAVSLYGSIGGTFQIDTSVPFTTLPDGTQIAAVNEVGSDPHVLTIYDADGMAFTATVDFVSIQANGAGGVLLDQGAVGVINLTDFSYAGTNTDLQQLASYQNGSINASTQLTVFQPNPSGGSPTQVPITLDYLTTPQAPGQTPADGTYSGSISGAVPLPAGWLMMGLGSLVLGGARVVRRRPAKV